MRWTPLIFLVFVGASAVIYPFWPLERNTIWFGAVAQLTAILVASYNTTLARNAYGRNDEPRDAWGLITVGLWIWLLAQLLESYCDLVLNIISYGTIADAFWSIGYFPLVAGVWKLVQNYRKSGLPLGSKISYVVQFTILLALYCVVFYLYLLGQITDPERRFTLKFLDVFYSGMDFLLVCLCSVLIRVAWMMRGGSLARSWVFLCLGFIGIGFADLWLSYATDFESVYYRLNDLTYFSSYFLIALAGMYQVRMLKTV